MPIYEYECLSCGGRFDVLQKLSDPSVTECRLCNGVVRKLMGTPALQFKGSGWYVTDYAGKTPPPAGNGEPKDKPSSDGGAAAGEASSTDSPSAATAKSEPACACSSGGCGAKKA